MNKDIHKTMLSGAKLNNECLTTPEDIEEFKKIIEIKDQTVWCPFDKETSEFVKWMGETNTVVHSHIDEGKDYYKYEPDKWDLLISNPPFEKKRLIVERALSFNKPFCLLFGANICSQTMGNTLNKCDLWFIQKSLTFLCEGGGKKKFQCCLVMSKDFKEKYFKDE